MLCSMCQHGINVKLCCRVCGACPHIRCAHKLSAQNNRVFGVGRKYAESVIRKAVSVGVEGSVGNSDTPNQ